MIDQFRAQAERETPRCVGRAAGGLPRHPPSEPVEIGAKALRVGWGAGVRLATMVRVLSLLLVLAAAAGGALFLLLGEDEGAVESSLMPPATEPASEPKPAAPKPAAPELDAPELDAGAPVAALRAVAKPAQITAAERAVAARRARLATLWKRAVVLHGMQHHARALALVESFLATDGVFFEESSRAALLVAMRAGATMVHAAEAEGAGERLQDLVSEVRRWGNLRPLTDADDASALEQRLRHAAGVIAKIKEEPQCECMVRHLERFLVRSGRRPADSRARSARGAKATLDVDALLEAVQAMEDGREEPTLPLPISEAEAVEARRMAQLEALRTRGALTLLDSLHAGLAWLALIQGRDGRFSVGAASEYYDRRYEDDPAARRAARGHTGPANDRYAVSTTALALMAFLDFRDQDGRGLFEPTIARGVAWLRKRQSRSGLFKNAGRKYYSDAMALMALAQAAHATGDEGLRAAVSKGLAALYQARGANGGYRYNPREAGDTSVSAWVAQAVEYALLAGAEVPAGMQEDLLRFLGTVSIGGPRFAYTGQTRRSGGIGSPSLYPAGMLMARILRDEVPKADHKAWGVWLSEGVGKQAPHLYTLYYGVRMDVWVHGKLTPRWHGWLTELAGKQLVKGPVAGAFPRDIGRLGRVGGTPLITAFALLTMEHALFSR